ncbi:MAG: translation initiation factor IF-2 [Thermodesulfobacteriota bacterium]|nr:translation initiation factor IF-2 [Thermodesulfobacteriota bacterium]
MSRVRIYELAKEAGMASKALAEKLIALGYDIKGLSSTVDDETALKIRKEVLQSSESELVEKRIDAKSGATVIRRRATVIRRPPKKASEEEVEETVESPAESDADTEIKAEKESKAEIEAEATPETPEEEYPVDESSVQEPAVEEKGEDQVLSEAHPETPVVEQKPGTKDEVSVEIAAKIPSKTGIAKVVGTIELPKEERQKSPARNKGGRPPARRPASRPQDNQAPLDPAAASRRKKKGKKGGTAQSEDDSRKGGKGGWKGAKKGRKNVRVTKFGYDGDRYGKRGKKGRGRVKSAPQQPAAEMKASKKRIKVYETISVGDLAHRMGVKANEIIAKLMGLGVMATVNQALDVDTAVLVASDFGYEVEQAITEEIGVEQLDKDEGGGEAIARSPVITVMGHVDHGKTSILDAIRKTDVADGEAGGITQHIGAYHVKSPSGDVTFVDTPGHAAFTEMRSRGAQITDLVILVVAADDGVMDQTREAIHHAQAANVPIIVAVNKIDKDNADPERVKRELAELDLAPEEWGGQTIFCEMSAKANIGIDTLLENIELMAEMLELKADPGRKARGRVVEAKLDKGRGAVATVLIQEGTLKAGDHFVVGQFSGKVRALLNDKSKPIKSAGPSMPVEVQGITGVPSAGDEFVVVTDEKMAKNVAQVRTLKVRESELAAGSKVSLDTLFEKLSEGDVQELRIVLRADVQGTLEAFGQAAEKLSTDEVKVKILHEGTGTMTDSDVLLASASEAVIIGFNVRPSGKVKELAAKENVDMRSYDVIYHALDDITQAMLGMLAPDLVEDVIGNAEVRETFQAPKVGTIAGCFVTDGKIVRNASVHVLRDGVVVYTGKIESLRRFKDDAKEVQSGYECGMSIENFNDIKVGDNLEAFVMKEVAATLGATKVEKDAVKADNE